MVIQGVIRPPPEIRAVADRTAAYVAKNGRAFETRILSSAKGKTPKFAFLQHNNPFNAYYQERIQFYENGGTDEPEEKDKSASNNNSNKEQGESSSSDPRQEHDDGNDKKKQQSNGKTNIQSKATQSAIDPVAKALLTHRNRIAQLKAQAKTKNDINDDTTSPENTAAAAAAAAATPNQAAVNIPPPRPLHFINIVPPASLTVVQLETIQLVAQLTALDGRGGTFLATLTRREWNNPLYNFCQPRHGHFAYFSALVDAYRHVLSTWTATDTTATDGTIKSMANQPARCLEVAAYRAEYKRHLAEERRRHAAQSDLPAAAQIDWHDFCVVETIDFPKDEQVVTLPPPPPPAQVQPQSRSKTTDDMQDSDEDDDDDQDEPIRVVPTYQPKVVSAAQSGTMETVIDPISGQRVRVADMPEHMRIQLLDPKWAEERKKFQDKQKDSNLVGGDVVASNLARLAQARGIASKDVLDTKGDAKKRLQDANRVLREQALDPKTKVGPTLPQEPKRPPPSEPSGASAAPEAKRPRITEVLPPPPTAGAPPGYGGYTHQPAAPAPDPFASAGTAPAFHATLQTQSEADFMASLPRPEVTLQIRVPNDPAQMAWNFYGQIVSLTVHCMSNVKTVKEELSRQHLNQMPINKVQLKLVTTGAFLNKNNQTLAALNIGPTATLELIPKTRGGRK